MITHFIIDLGNIYNWLSCVPSVSRPMLKKLLTEHVEMECDQLLKPLFTGMLILQNPETLCNYATN